MLRLRVAVGLAFVFSCGARTDLGRRGDASVDAGRDAPADVTVDVREVDVVLPDVIEPSSCTVTSEDPSFGATESIDACNEGQNISSPLDPNCTTGSVAWEYVPSHDIDVTRLELDVSGGGVALYDSDGGAPGAKLFEGTFDTGPQAWRGVDVTPPVHLTACHMYFIQQVTSGQYVGCSIATGGVAQRQFNPPGFDGPGWGGPYIWLPWSARVIGTCP